MFAHTEHKGMCVSFCRECCQVGKFLGLDAKARDLTWRREHYLKHQKESEITNGRP